MIDPNQYIITRKRKKYRFALFANSPLCFEVDEWQRQWSAQVIEVGAGTGESLVSLAAQHPERRYLAVDVKGDRLQRGARLAEATGCDNIRFLRARADQLTMVLPPAVAQQIWLTFSDPFPKARSAGRRLTHRHFLAQYRRLLGPDGRLIVKHDDPTFFAWSLEQLVADGWRIDQLSFDLHQSTLDDEYKIMTRYEQRWLEAGRRTHLVRARQG